MAFAPLVERGISLSNRACSWLSGSQVSDVQWVKFDVPDPPGRLRIEVGQAMRRLVSNGKLRAAVVGPPGSGKLAVTIQLAHVYAPEGGVYFIALSEDEHDDRTRVQQALLHAALTGSMIAVEVSPDPKQQGSQAMGKVLEHAPVSVVYLLGDATDRPKSVPPENVIRIGYPSREQRLSEWKHHLGDRANDDLCSHLAGSFILSEGQIQRAVKECFAQKTNGGTLDDALFSSARAQSETGLGSLAQPELCTIGLDSVILDVETRTLVEELLAYAKHRHELAHDWGFEAAMPYGLGLTALFTGPPGTGKTLAATAIAKELGHELYRVDLSQLVSKYIGETEKHLAALFDAASKGGIMLLFDEADSVFGKRTEVRNSVDRYANLEVNYLLQRIERFDGVVILTTNLDKGIDDAFARRIRFKIDFPLPNAEARRRLWRALIPQQVPLSKNVDMEALAQEYELSGGHIKEVVLRAASLALQNGGVVNQEILKRCSNAEYRKLGKLIAQNEEMR